MYDHLSLPKFVSDLERKKRGGGGYNFPQRRIKKDYYHKVSQKANEIASSYAEIKEKFNGKINPNLIYRIAVNQSVDYDNFIKSLHAMGGINVLSVAENGRGFWVVFSNDTEFQVFMDKLAQYSEIRDGKKYDFFNAIETIEDIPIEDKIGKNLSLRPLKEGEVDYLDLELWRMEDEYINKFIDELKNTYKDQFKICDKLITKSFALFRVKISFEVLSEIINFKEIARVDRPFVPTFKLSDYYRIDVSDLEILPPNEDAVGILVIDSGIVSNHPLLARAIGDEKNFQEKEKELQDKVGHGTAVAGVSLYGDIKYCVNEKRFMASNWLFSAKVMYGKEDFQGNVVAVYDEEKLFENQLNSAIRTFLDNEAYKIKVVNISFGNANESLRDKNNRQFPLASLLDELAYEYSDVVFVVSAGNNDPRNIFDDIDEIVNNYPNYLIWDKNFRIINPATSALSITVGSIAQEVNILDNHKADLYIPIAKQNKPSPFTRTGYGINGMIKPEVVHYGGNLILKNYFGKIIEDLGGKLPVLSNNPTECLFKFDNGTSFSSPMVTHLIGMIANKYQDKSANFIKNLLLQSTETLDIDELFDGSESHRKNSSLRVQGYGLPNFETAISSFDNRVVLLNEDVIGLDEVHLYSFDLPSIFFKTKGEKKISVVLTFNPVTRMTRGDSYLGNRMQFKLYHSIDPNIVAQRFAEYDFSSDDDDIMKELDGFEIKLHPGPSVRNKGCHQKGVKVYKRSPRKIMNSTLTLVVINSNKWITNEYHKQDYCISVTVEHSQDIQLYSEIRTSVQQRVRVR